MADLFRIAVLGAAASEAERTRLKDQITRLVGYSCMISCHPNHGAVDIYVMCSKKRVVTDWLELQDTGAIGVVFDSYDRSKKAAMNRLDDVCEHYNVMNGFDFSDSEEDSDSEEEAAAVAGAGEAAEAAAGAGEAAGAGAAAGEAAADPDDKKEKMD